METKMETTIMGLYRIHIELICFRGRAPFGGPPNKKLLEVLVVKAGHYALGWQRWKQGFSDTLV